MLEFCSCCQFFIITRAGGGRPAGWKDAVWDRRKVEFEEPCILPRSLGLAAKPNSVIATSCFSADPLAFAWWYRSSNTHATRSLDESYEGRVDNGPIESERRG